MKHVLMVLCLVLALWLSGCAQDEKGPEIEQPAGESHKVEPMATEEHQLEQRVNEGYGNYLLVPAGRFSMGDNYGEGDPREGPVHAVYVDTFYIGEFEVTNKEFKRFIEDGGYENKEHWSNGGFGRSREPLHWHDAEYNGGGVTGNGDFPVVGVSWFEAAAYCSWLSAKTRSVYRLPTEAEWEKAARGGDYLDGDETRQVPNPILQRRYPWGNEIDGSYANYLDSGDPYDNGLTPVGYYDGSVYAGFVTQSNASPYGAYDMAGNVYEWIKDYYQERYEPGTATNPQGPQGGSGHVIRGSAFLYETFKQRSAYRGAYYPSFQGAYIGIRCVRETTEAPLSPTESVNESTFTVTLGGTGRDRGIHLLQTRDGGYAVVGYTNSLGAGHEDVYLVRLSSEGETLWSKTYGGTGKDNGWAILETEGGGFSILGFTSSFGAGEIDMYLILTDAEGNLLWERTFGGPGSEYGWAMAPTADGGYVLLGQTDSFGQGDKDGYLIKVDADGGEIWNQTFGGPEEDRLYSIDQAADEGFILVGTTTSYGAGNRNAYLVKTDDSGQLAWTQVFGQDQDDVGHSVRQTSDGGYIVTGYTGSFGAKNYDTWLLKTDEAGAMKWQKLYGEERDDRTIYGEQTDDGGYILVGYTKGFGAAGWDLFLVRTDLAGEVLWHRTFGGSADDTGYTVRQTADKGFVLTGETFSFGEGGGDLYVIKVNQGGEMSKETGESTDGN